MNVFEAIMNRRSIRKFEKTPVDEKLIGLILFSATQAPSSGNVQDWNFIVVMDEEKKKRLARAALDQDFIVDAPINIVVCTDLEKISLRYGERGKKLYSIQNTAAAVQNILLAAHALGLGSVWVGAFDEEEVKTVLELPDNLRPVAILPIGYPAERPKAPDRIPFENLTYVNRFGERYEFEFKNLAAYLREAFKKFAKRKVEKPSKKLTFEEFLRRLAK